MIQVTPKDSHLYRDAEGEIPLEALRIFGVLSRQLPILVTLCLPS